MYPRKKLYLLLLSLALASVSLSCATTKANKFIDEGNAAVEEGKKLYEQADTKGDELVAALEGFPDNRDQLKPKAQEVIDLLDKSIAKLREGANKYDEGSKTNLEAPLKEYLSLKSQEFTKHAEHLEVEKDIPNAVMDSTIDSTNALKTRFIEIKERIEKLEKEWTDLAQRANKIQEENKAKFKS